MPAVISPPMLANGPDIGTITPTLTASARAARTPLAIATAASAHGTFRNDMSDSFSIHHARGSVLRATAVDNSRKMTLGERRRCFEAHVQNLFGADDGP